MLRSGNASKTKVSERIRPQLRIRKYLESDSQYAVLPGKLGGSTIATLSWQENRFLSLFNIFRIATAALTNNKRRAGLTSLGVVIG
ncbi:MAG: hypothetical protein ACK6A7_17725, partial [Planctomycetota bacterium]